MSNRDSLEVVEIKNVDYKTDNLSLLKNISFSLKSNRINTLIGPNGSGKTLTNKILALLLIQSSGNILWDGIELPVPKELDELVVLRRNIGFVPQKPSFLNKSIEENCEIPLILIGEQREIRKKKVHDALIKFELDQLKTKNPFKLSFGQQQKLSLLISTIKEPSLMILDEPTASLDPKNTLWFESFIKQNYISTDKVLLWTTHDIHQMERISDQVIFIINGKIMETGDKSILKDPENKKVAQYLNGELIID